MKRLLLAALLAGWALVLPSAGRVVPGPRGAVQGGPPSGAVEGSVLTPEGRPARGALVFAERENFLKGIVPVVRADAEGRFVLKGLEPGTYKVYASKEEDGYPLPTSLFHTGGATAIPRVSVREREVTPGVLVHLAHRGATLVGRLTDAVTKRAVKAAQITLRRADNPAYYFITGPGQQGEFNILVPAVPITVEASAPGYEGKRLRDHFPQQGARKRLDISLRSSH